MQRKLYNKLKRKVHVFVVVFVLCLHCYCVHVQQACESVYALVFNAAFSICLVLSFTDKLSKSALRNRKKREAKQRSKHHEETTVESRRSQDQQDAVAMAAHLFGSEGRGAGGGGERNSDKEKKLKNLRKVSSSPCYIASGDC